MPALITGPRCYTDASTQQDANQRTIKDAGLGVFMLNQHIQGPQAIFIQAKAMNMSSVLMAEAAAMTLASRLVTILQL